MDSCYLKNHEINSVFTCSFCDKQFDKVKALNKHLQVHENLIKFSCNICSKEFKHKDSLKNHRKSAHEVKVGEEIFYFLNKKEKPNCKTCDKQFKNNWNLKQHMKVVHKNENRNDRLVFGKNIFIVEECNNNSNKDIDDMMKDTVEDLLDIVIKEVIQKQLSCSVCGLRVAHKKALSDHKLKVHQQKEPCKKCHKKFNPGYHMRRHMKLVHSTPELSTPERNPKRKREMNTPAEDTLHP